MSNNLVVNSDGSVLQSFGGPDGTSDYGNAFVATKSVASSVTFDAIDQGGSAQTVDMRAIIVPLEAGDSDFTAPIYVGTTQAYTISGSSMTAFTLSLGSTPLVVGQEYAVLVEYVPTAGFNNTLAFAQNDNYTSTQYELWYNGQPNYPSLPSSGQFAPNSWGNEGQDWGTLQMNLAYGATTPAPTVAITSSPLLTNQALQTISGTADVADAGSTVSIYDNGGTMPVATAVVQPNGTWSTSVTLAQGANALVAKDTNAGGTGSSTSITDTLDTHTPGAPSGLSVSVSSGHTLLNPKYRESRNSTNPTSDRGQIREYYAVNSLWNE